MKIRPILFSFIFFTASSGLSAYAADFVAIKQVDPDAVLSAPGLSLLPIASGEKPATDAQADVLANPDISQAARAEAAIRSSGGDLSVLGQTPHPTSPATTAALQEEQKSTHRVKTTTKPKRQNTGTDGATIEQIIPRNGE